MASKETKLTSTNVGNNIKDEDDVEKIDYDDVAQIDYEQEKRDIENVGNGDHGEAPIDRGWAWVVLAGSQAFNSLFSWCTLLSALTGCVFEITIYGGLMRSFGFFFLQYQKRFGSSASETAIMNMIQNLVVSIAALFVMTIGMKHFSSRVSVFTGGVLTVVGYLLTTFAKSLGMFYFAQGIICGAGMAFIHSPALAIIGVYFKKHRGLANSIFMAGSSVGGLVFAPVVVILFEKYQYSGAMLIVSGMLMNIMPAALLMRPIDFFTRNKHQRRKPTSNSAEEELMEPTSNSAGAEQLEATSDSAGAENVLPVNEATHHRMGKSCHVTDDVDLKTLNEYLEKNNLRSYEEDDKLLVDITEGVLYDLRKTQSMRLESLNPQNEIQNCKGSPIIFRARAMSVSARQQTTFQKTLHFISRSQSALYSCGEGICGSFIDVYTLPIQPENGDINAHDKQKPEKEDVIKDNNFHSKCCLPLKKCLLSVLCTVFDLEILKKPVFLLFLLMAFSAMSGLTLSPVFIPTYANEINISNEKIGLLISLLAIIDLVAKVTMGLISDRGWLQRPTILAGACFLIGTASHLIRFVNTFPLMVFYVVIAGICCGQYMSMYAVLLIDVIGPEKFKSSLGFGTLVHGVSIAVFFPITGFLRDLRSTYVVPMHLLGGLAYLSGILALLIPNVNKRYKARKNQKQKY